MFHELLQGINRPSSFKFSVIGFNPSLALDFRGYCFWCGNMCGSLSLLTTGTDFCIWSTVFPSVYTLGFTFYSINGRERESSIFMKIKAWILLSISFPKMGERDSGTIRNLCAKGTESQLQFRGQLKQHLAHRDSPIMEADRGESGPGPSVNTE